MRGPNVPKSYQMQCQTRGKSNISTKGVNLSVSLWTDHEMKDFYEYGARVTIRTVDWNLVPWFVEI
jgi:hypothetical protein